MHESATFAKPGELSDGVGPPGSRRNVDWRRRGPHLSATGTGELENV